MFLDKQVEIMTTGKLIKYYQDLGYNCGYRTTIMVNIEDLPPRSNKKLDVECDYCHKVFQTTLCDLSRSPIKKHACKDCARKKAEEATMIKYGKKCYLATEEGKRKKKESAIKNYGVDNVAKAKEVQEKIKKTNLQKYGVECVFQSEEIKEKIVKTNIERYGVSNPQKNESIKEKTQNTNLKKYGYTNPLYVPEIKEKIKKTNLEKYGTETIGLHNPIIRSHHDKTMLERYGVTSPSLVPEFSQKAHEKSIETIMERYGVDNASKIPEAKEKIREAFMKNNQSNGIIFASKNQKILNSLYNGILNYPTKYYFLDIYLPNEQIYCEYDGSGHDLNVQMNKISKEEFMKKEVIRYETLKKEGLKLFRIVHKGKSLPSTDFLLHIKSFAFEMLKNTNSNWITFDLDNQTIKTKDISLKYS